MCNYYFNETSVNAFCQNAKRESVNFAMETNDDSFENWKPLDINISIGEHILSIPNNADNLEMISNAIIDCLKNAPKRLYVLVLCDGENNEEIVECMLTDYDVFVIEKSIKGLVNYEYIVTDINGNSFDVGIVDAFCEKIID